MRNSSITLYNSFLCPISYLCRQPWLSFKVFLFAIILCSVESLLFLDKALSYQLQFPLIFSFPASYLAA